MAENTRSNADIYISQHSHVDSALNNVIPDKEDVSFTEKVLKPRPIRHKLYDHIRIELKEHNPDETILWIGRSSQLIHVTTYTLCFMFGFLLFPLLIAYLVYLHTKNTIYVLTKERLRVYSGIFTKQINDLELYRVKDTRYVQPFLFRFFGLSNLQLYTSDITWGESVIPGIENGMALREKIRKLVEAARVKKGVREFDYYTRSAPPLPTPNT